MEFSFSFANFDKEGNLLVEHIFINIYNYIYIIKLTLMSWSKKVLPVNHFCRFTLYVLLNSQITTLTKVWSEHGSLQ